jgi:hypothetical protein
MNTFRRSLFMYETPEDGGGAAEVEAVADEDLDLQGVDLDALDGASDTEVEEAAWALSQSDWETTLNYLQQTAPILQQVAQVLPTLQQQPQQGNPTDQTPDIDPFDPQSVQAFIQQQVQAGIGQALQQQMAPYEGVLSSFASEQGAAMAKAELETIKETVGDFDQDNAFLIAAGSIEQGQDPTQALHQAARFTHDFEKRIRADERNRFKEELRSLQAAPNETPAGSGSAAVEVQPVPTGPRRYHEVVERYLERQNPSSVVG